MRGREEWKAGEGRREGRRERERRERKRSKGR